MPDKKLTDNEIVKEFQLCTLKAEHPGFVLCGQIVDLINRQKAEIERLKEKKSKLENKIDEIYPLVMQLPNTMQQTKAEAYKECIEKAKEQCRKIPPYHFNLLNVEWYLDNLLK